MFPKSTVKAIGSTYDRQNKKKGDFHGHIREMRPIKSSRNSTCFAVLDIIADGERLPFQFFLNYNPSQEKDKEGRTKEQKSINFIVGKVKELARACGKPVTLETERDLTWCEGIINNLIEEKCEFDFHQEPSEEYDGGVDITFGDIETTPTQTTNKVEY